VRGPRPHDQIVPAEILARDNLLDSLQNDFGIGPDITDLLEDAVVLNTLPELGQTVNKIGSVFEVPVEAALGDAKRFDEPNDPQLGLALSRQHIQRPGQEVISTQCLRPFYRPAHSVTHAKKYRA
jgi:hypothetical protein